MRLQRLGQVPWPYRRARVAGVGLAVLGVVGLGLAAVPACGGGGGVGSDDVVHLAASGTALALGVATPDCGGGGGIGDD